MILNSFVPNSAYPIAGVDESCVCLSSVPKNGRGSRLIR